LPVGAASAIRGRSVASATSANNRATVVVLPVPGPPVSTVTDCDSAVCAADRCSANSGGNSRSRAASVISEADDAASACRSCATNSSSRQYLSRYNSLPS
jgi:hypothetical protein